MQYRAKRRRKVWEKLLSKLSVRGYLVHLSPAIVLTVASCGAPYAPNLGRLNYSGVQQPAVIQISDPQLYKREALINERRDEIEYLNTLMQGSREQKFEPELMRELEAISAFSAQLGVKFDPAPAIAYQRAVELGDLQQETQATKLQMQLAQLKRDLELLKEKLPEQKTPSVLPASVPPVEPGSNVTPVPPGATPPTKEEMKEVTARLEKLVKDVTDRVDKKSEPLRRTGATASPRDQFLDRQAYRSEIRDALNAASLDELHDYQGNSLYRMQFHATVLPGPELNTLGILRMQVTPPQLDSSKPDDRIILEGLYLSWLGHVTGRLNSVGSDGEIRPNQVLLQLGATGVYFGILEYQVPKPGKDKTCHEGPFFDNPDTTNCHIIRIALPPRTARDFAEVYRITHEVADKEVDVSAALSKVFIELLQKKSTGRRGDEDLLPFSLSAANGCETFLKWRTIIGNINNQMILSLARMVLESKSIRIQNIGYQSELGVLPRQDRERIISMMTKITSGLREEAGRLFPQSDGFIAMLRELNPECKEYLPEVGKPTRSVGGVPPDFVAALFEDVEERAFQHKAKGRVSVYAASPIELVQRVSSVARAANALEFAAAVAAVLPANGVGASGNLGYTHSVIGKADALERVPLVVGFSEANETGSTPLKNAGFGWLVGPKVVLNSATKALELEHRVEPYSLTADISMPGWWPYVDLHAQSAWAPNWRNDSGDILEEKEAHHKVIRVPMRHNRSDMDAITDLLLAPFTGERMEVAEIERIDPDVVSACAGKVTFLIRGSNIWRETKVYLLGQQGTDIKVLPDMAGIEVTFDIQSLPQRSSARPAAQLTVWTRNGVATAEVNFTGKKKSPNECVDEGTPPVPPDDKGPR